MSNDDTPPPVEVVENPTLSFDQVEKLTDEEILAQLKALTRQQRNTVLMLMVSMQARWWFELNVYRHEPDKVTILTKDLKLHQAIYAGVSNLCHIMNNRQVSKFTDHVRALGALVGIEVKL